LISYFFRPNNVIVIVIDFVFLATLCFVGVFGCIFLLLIKFCFWYNSEYSFNCGYEQKQSNKSRVHSKEKKARAPLVKKERKIK
jgi:hypothetical protein